MKRDNLNILVTGGCGSIGGAVVHRLLKTLEGNFSIRILSRNDSTQHDFRETLTDEEKTHVRFILGDVTNDDTVKRAVSGVSHVIHCAALKHVDNAEYNAFEVQRVNIGGTYTVLHALHQQASLSKEPTTMVLLSTDKAVDPSNVMGASKRVAEHIMLGATWAHNTVLRRVVRFGNVFGSRGSVFPTFVEKLLTRRTIDITNYDMTRFVISPRRAAELLVHAAEQEEKGCFLMVPIMKAATLRSMYDAALLHAGGSEDFQAADGQVRVVGPKIGEKHHEALVTDHEWERVYMHDKEMGVLFIGDKKTTLKDSPEGNVNSSQVEKLTPEALLELL